MKINVPFIPLKKGEYSKNQAFEIKEIMKIGKESKNLNVELRNQWSPKLVALKEW